MQHAYVGVCLNGAGNAAQIATTRRPELPQPGHARLAGGAIRASRPGDTITAINGTAIATTDQFIATIDKYKPGQTVTMTIKRSGQTKQLKVTLGNRPAQTPNGG